MDLLGEVLQIDDVIGVSQIRRRHLPEGVMAELVKQTHEHALADASGDSDGWLIFRGGIEPWWRDAGDLTKDEFGWVFHLRTDVIEQLRMQALAERRHPRSTLLYVRPSPLRVSSGVRRAARPMSHASRRRPSRGKLSRSGDRRRRSPSRARPVHSPRPV